MTPEEINMLCMSEFSCLPDRIETPGGSGRGTVIVVIGETRFVVAQRDNPGRALLEATALRSLAPTGLVPQLVSCRGRFVIQHHVAGIGLPKQLAAADDRLRAALLSQAVEDLLALQSAGANTELRRSAPAIGRRQGWTADLMRVPQRLADRLGLPAPLLDQGSLSQILTGQPLSFVKWDARPGNALLRPDGRLCWIDWEHCGLRARADDLVWLLADEWAPDLPGVEEDAINRLAEFTGRPKAETAIYFASMAVLHSFVRLSLIFTSKADGTWWDPEICLRFDLVGVTAQHVVRQCDRASRLADQVKNLRELLPLLTAIRMQALAS